MSEDTAHYHHAQLELSFTLNTGLHIGTGFGLGKLVDARAMRGPHAEPTYNVLLPYVPGASLKGRLKFHAEQLSSTLAQKDGQQLLVDLFGTEQVAGRLVFADAHLAADDEQAIAALIKTAADALAPAPAFEIRPRVALSRVRRSARDQMLLRLEVASPGLRMVSTIQGWLPSARSKRALALLALAARSLTHLGGHKARGLGAVSVPILRAELEGKELTLAELGDML